MATEANASVATEKRAPESSAARAHAIWARYGRYVIAIVAVALLAAGGYYAGAVWVHR